MGRGPKAGITPDIIDDFVAGTMASDVLSMEEAQNFPELRTMSTRDQMIMLASAAGVSQSFIADFIGSDQPHVSRIIKRLDPDNVYKLSANSRKAFMTKLYETRGMEAMVSITPEKLKECSAVELARVAKTCTDAAASLNQTKHRGGNESRLDMLIGQIEAESVDIVEAEFEETNK